MRSNKKPKSFTPSRAPGQASRDNLLKGEASSIPSIYMVFIALYLLMDLVPAGEVIVGSMRHRFYVDVLNLIVAGYILLNYNKLFLRTIPTFFRQIVPVLYGLFVLLSALSISVAINKTEGWVDVSMYFSNFVTFVNIFALLYGTKDNIRFVAIAVTCILFCEVGIELYSFFNKLGTKDVAILANEMKWNAGNKNIFAAGIIVKFIFVIYASFRTKGFWRIFSYITLFLSIITIFVLSARASYLSLIAIVSLVGIGQLILYRQSLSTHKKPLYQSLFLFGLFIVGFLISNGILTKYAKATKQERGTEVMARGDSYIEGRLSSITDFENRSTYIRFLLWSTALEKAKENPVLGIGVGNYRIHSPYLMEEYYHYKDYTKYTHNDFVQIAVESGFVTALVYLLVFVFAFVYTVKIWVSSSYSNERKFVSILLLGGIIGFFIDLFFNFPLSKINMNIPFLLTLSLMLMNYISAKPKSDSAPAWGRYGYIALVILFLGAAYVNYEVFDSGKGQYAVRRDSENMDYANPKVALTYQQVDDLLSSAFPSIGNNSQPIVLHKARYLFAEKQYDKAFEVLEDIKKHSPYSLHYEVFSKRLYAATQNLDSALHYSTVLLEKRPYNKEDYTITVELAKHKKDVEIIKKAYALHKSYIATEQEYNDSYIVAMLQAGYDFTDDMASLDEGLKVYPDNELLKKLKTHFALLKDVKEGRVSIPKDQLPKIVFQRNEAGQMVLTFVNQR